MARGITESDVHAAADALVAAGERPTIERIRAHLGTGSPNTVTRWLETWWQALGARLQGHQARLAVPEAPEAVAALAGQWWELAIDAARRSLHESLSVDRATIGALREELNQDREALQTEAATLRHAAETASQAERVAVAQTTELQRLVNQLQTQGQDLGAQRDTALARVTELESTRQELETRLRLWEENARAERDNLAQHVRAVEDRTHAEVDRARQEGKEAQAQVVAAARERASSEGQLRAARDRAQAEAAQALQDAGVQRARADALEQQLGKLQDLPAALEASWIRSQRKPQPGSRTPGAGKAAGATGKRATKRKPSG